LAAVFSLFSVNDGKDCNAAVCVVGCVMQKMLILLLVLYVFIAVLTVNHLLLLLYVEIIACNICIL